MPSATSGQENALLLLSIASMHTTVQHHYEGNTATLATGRLQVLQMETAVSSLEKEAAGGGQPVRYFENQTATEPPSDPAPLREDVVTFAFLTVGDTYTRPLMPVTNVWKVGERGFIFPVEERQSSQLDGQGFHKIELGIDVTPSQLESFEDILAFTTLYARKELKSSLAFVNVCGQVVGTLADNVKFVEDSSVAQPNENDALLAKAPVVINYDEKASQIEGREVRRVCQADNIGDSIIYSSEIISEYIVKGANIVSEGILAGTQKLTAYISPNEKPLTFRPETKERVLRARNLTGAAVKVTSKVVETAVKMAAILGSSVLGGPSKNGSKSGKASATKSIKDFGVKLGHAIGNVGHGVDSGARILWNASSTSTASLVGHRYGAEAGNLTAEALRVAENLTLMYFDSKGVARRVIVRKAAAKLIKERAEMKRQQASRAGAGFSEMK